MRRLRFGGYHDDGGPVSGQRGGELVGEFFGAVDVDRPAPETGCDGGDIEPRQIQPWHAGGLLQHSERFEDRVPTEPVAS